MNRRVLITVVVLLGILGGGLLVGDLLPGDRSDVPAGDATTARTSDSGTARTTDAGAESPTARTESSSGDAEETTAGATTTGSSGYDFAIVAVENCGSTCRNVTVRLVNTGESPRENVRVTTKMYADDELLWSGNETVGELASGESHTSTKRVSVGLSGGVAISANDGYVTIVTVVESASGTTRFSERRKVAE